MILLAHPSFLETTRSGMLDQADRALARPLAPLGGHALDWRERSAAAAPR